MSEIDVDASTGTEQLGRSRSPIQEQHLDFLLEEEFSGNPEFIDFFISAASLKFAPQFEGAMIAPPKPDEQWDCHAVRSVTTSLGETDVLVVYRSEDPKLKRVAILIEDKIRAAFQKNQPGRYKERGEAGVAAKQWDAFWTCLVAPERYARDNKEFDARVSLEALHQFFKASGRRALFKAGVVERAIEQSQASGVQKVDAKVTEFRTFYAQQAAVYFKDSDVIWDEPRLAWFGDTWFVFKSALLPKGAVITHKASAGVVHLSFLRRSVTRLFPILENGLQGSQITAVQTNKSASFALSVTPITAFDSPGASVLAIKEALRAVSELMKFWRQNDKEIICQLDSADL